MNDKNQRNHDGEEPKLPLRIGKRPRWMLAGTAAIGGIAAISGIAFAGGGGEASMHHTQDTVLRAQRQR